MEIILEYTYTGSIKEEYLTKNNTIEAFYAADYFQLSDLQDLILKTVKNANFSKNLAPELLSIVSEKMTLAEDSILLNSLVESVASMSLNEIEFGRLSIAGLKCLLSYTYKKEKLFATPEYEVFRYSAILAAKEVSNDVHKILMKKLPTLKQLENTNLIKTEDKFTYHLKVAKKLEPLVRFIDLNQIKGEILIEIIEPLEIVPFEIILSNYRHRVLSNDMCSTGIRGNPYVLDESTCGSNLIIEDNGKVVKSNAHIQQCVRAKMMIENKGIFEWDVIIEEDSRYSWIGVCASKNFDYETWAGSQPTGWILGSDGRCCNFRKSKDDYCPAFGNGARVTVHLDMDKKTCAFTVNGTRYSNVSFWNNLPSKVYPVLSLCHPGQLRIQPHQKK
ncbi:hypothetical protein GLOIN_2v1842735 [Rhizophagus clarus]|nr:hypothetical protein GLOIN_2v1842735 [Rhizophagus clarus]